MKAKRTSNCAVCHGQIAPGEDISKDAEIGWIHSTCHATLDDPMPATFLSPFFYGPSVKTIRDRALYDMQADAAERAIGWSMFSDYYADYTD